MQIDLKKMIKIIMINQEQKEDQEQQILKKEVNLLKKK